MELSHAAPATDAPQQIYLKDYTQPSHWIRKTLLDFDIYEEYTVVTAKLSVERNETRDVSELVLVGQDMELLEVKIDGSVLAAEDYAVDAESLTLQSIDGVHELEIKTKIQPHLNSSLEGLYKSRTI